MNEEWWAEGAVRDDILAIGDRVESGETLRSEDIPTLVDAIDGGFATHIVAIDTILSLADDSPATIEERYPNIVETLLASRDELAVAREFLHGAIQLRVRGVALPDIRSGIEASIEPTFEHIWDIGAETPGDDDSLPGGGATEMQLASRLREHADSVGGREQLVVELVADSYEAVPARRAAGLGVDPIDTLVDLRARHHQGGIETGVSEDGDVTEMDGEADRIGVERLFNRLPDAMVAAELILLFEREPARLLRSEAVLAERL